MRARAIPIRSQGFSLLEVMMAMAVLLIGLLGMMHLQVFGFTSNQGARAHTTASQLAKELAGALSRLPFDNTDARLGGGGGAAPPTPFGSLLFADRTAAHRWDDANPVPGARLDSAIEKGLNGQPIYQRYWTVWDFNTGSATTGAKIIAVSVIYQERRNTGDREALVYTQIPNAGAVIENLTAYR